MAELGPTGSLNHLLGPLAALPFSTGCVGPEHQHRNCIPDVAAEVPPASCIKWKEPVTLLNKISLTKALSYHHSPVQSPNSREEIKAWLLARCSACPRYEMQPQQFEHPFQKKWLMSVGKWEEPKCWLQGPFFPPVGVIDDRGKFIYITPEEMAAVAQYIKQRGRVSIAELAQASNSLINLQPESQAGALTMAWNCGVRKIQQEFNLLMNKPHN